MAEISSESTKEEVAEYCSKKYKISDESKNLMIKEDISGDTLLYLKDTDFGELKLKLGKYKKIQNYVEANKDKFKEKEIKEVITAKSNPEKVKSFFERCLYFKGDLNNLDGKGLIDLDEEGMKKLGLNLGQRKKLPRYIEYFKTLKEEEPPEQPGGDEIMVSKDSSEEDVAKFLEMRLKFSKDSIEDLGLDGESLFMLQEDDINKSNISQEEKDKLKKFLSEGKIGEKEDKADKKEEEIKVTKTSTNEEVAKFLKVKLGFKDESIEELDLDGESLFMLNETEIDKLADISKEEKDNLKKFLAGEKSKNEQNTETKSEQEPVQPKKPEENPISIKKPGENPISNKKPESKPINEIRPDNEILEEPFKEIVLSEKSNKDEVAKYLKKNMNFSDKSIKELDLDGKKLFSLDGKAIDKLDKLNEEEKEKLRKYLKIEKPKIEKKPVDSRKKITKESKKEEIIQFLKKYVKLEGEKYDLISDSEIDKLSELEKDEKDIIKHFLKEEKNKIKNEPSRGEPKKIDNNVSNSENSDNSAPSPLNDNNNINERNKNPKPGNIDMNLNEEDSNGNGRKTKPDGKSPDQNLDIPENSGNGKKNNIRNIRDPLDNRRVEEQKVEKDRQSDKKKFHELKKCKIQPMDVKSKYNIFFIFSIQEKYIKYISLSTSYEVGGYFSSSYINYDFLLIYEVKKYTLKGEPTKSFIVQVPLEKPIQNLSLTLLFNKNFREEYNTSIEVKGEDNNYFYLNNHYYNRNNDFIEVMINSFFTNYFSFFFDKNLKIKETYQKSLINALINKISSLNRLELGADNILRFFKYCLKFNLEPQNIEAIEILEEKKNKRKPLDPEYCLLSEEIDKLILNEQRPKFNDLIVCIYANYNKEYLMKLIFSNSANNYNRAILDLLMAKTLDLNDLSFKKEQDLKIFQINLLSVSKSKDEINYILKITNGFTKSLEFLQNNLPKICLILEENAGLFKREKTNYLLTLANLTKDDNDINEIYRLLSNILSLTKDKGYKIINLEEIFDNMVDFFSSKELNAFCTLHNIVGLLKAQKINSKSIDNFYYKVHQKGMYLIKHNKLEVAEIINFMIAQDIYYYNPSFKNNENRDPIIFSYIPITDIDKNYLANIQLIKDNDLWNIFSNSSYNTIKNFQEIILKQMRNVKDFASIFKLFPYEYYDKGFTFLINGKIHNFRYSILDEKEADYNKIFEVIDNWFNINIKNNLDLNYLINSIEFNYNFTSKYFFHLLKSEKMIYTANLLKNAIIDFFLQQDNAGNNNAESLISLLLLCKNSDLCVYFLDQLNKNILTEKDFYNKEETDNFLLFKLFLKKCNDLIQNPNIYRGIYLRESLSIKKKIQTDLKNNDIQYEIANNLIDENNTFYNKILAIESKAFADKIYDNIKNNYEICKKKFEELALIEDYYSSFFSYSKREQILLIKQRVQEFTKKNISEIVNYENFLMDNNNFDYAQALEESKDIKYKNSSFFMAIYNKIKNDNLEKSEEEIFNDSKDNYKDTIQRIINQKESKEPFFGINNVKEILKVVQNTNNDMKKEINFIEEEFKDLNKKDYIKKYLLNDLINFSNKDKVSKLINGIIYFIESYNKINPIQMTEFINNFKSTYDTIMSNGVSGEEIKKAIDLLKKYDYDIKYETSLSKFYELLLGKEEAILFIKQIKDSNLDIRNLNEFIDETDNSQLQTTDIDNLMDVYRFFIKLMENKSIKSDEILLKIFRNEFEKNKDNKDIVIKMQGYLNIYGEIIQLYSSYHSNPEMTIQKVISILNDSTVKIYKENNLFTFNIQYASQNNKPIEINELEELRNKLLMSSTNTNSLKNEDEGEENQQNIRSKEKITKEFITLIDHIKQLNETLNSLLKSGYPKVINLSLVIKNSHAYDKHNSKKDLEKIIEEYNELNKNFKKSIKNGYKEYPYLRLFYGRQFIQLYEKAKNNNADISHLINSVSLNQMKDEEIIYDYNNDLNEMENINNYLKKLFEKNNININEIYQKNKVLEETFLTPGLYRKVKYGDNINLVSNILNIYLNLTGNTPTINTLLICNEDTTIEKIKSFLYRAIFCDKPILFVLANMECLELSVTQNAIKTLKFLYKLKNQNVNSYLLFFYEKVDSGLARDIEKLIHEKNMLADIFMKQYDKPYEAFEKIDLYSSKFSGYGKTTEIIYKVREKGGNYHYLPIGGSFKRNYVMDNLKNLKLDLKNGKNCYIHLDLSDTDNDDLMNEVLFNITILRYLESNETIYYLGKDINLIIEIPKGYVEFDKKYKLLGLFNKILIEKLKPLRMEENIQRIRDSPISIVAEVLELYDNNKIATENIDLDSPIQKNAAQCEQIINKHFQVQNQNYYQKMNFIKILSIQFKKFTENPYFNYDIARSTGKEGIIKKARVSVIKNFIALTKVFTRSPFDTVLLRQTKSLELFRNYDDNEARQEEINDLADDNKKQEIFSFEKIKPSLVFFNRDGGSLSIISNNDKNDKEYKDLKELWNSQNVDLNKTEELINYKTMQHEEFLDQIKKLFSLDKMTIEDIKKLCENLGNYIFVSDNFIKMVRILLNIEAKIPVILMGETGVGKTKLLEMLTTLYGKGECRWKRLQIHAGTTDTTIVEFLDKVTQEVKDEGAENQLTWIFLDEINTCNSLGLITEIMCNHTYLGKKINDNFVFLGACNPYRILTKTMRESGLVYYNLTEKSKLNNLVYTVNPLPHALLNFVFDFASLQEKDENKYINNTILSIVSKIEREGLIKNINQNELKRLTNEMIESISICHKFIREKYDKSSVSLREIRRFGIFFEYFIKYFNETAPRRVKYSINMTLYLCYYLRLNDKTYRKELAEKLKKFYPGSSFLKIPDNEIKRITSEMSIEKGTGIALNRALRENLFTCYTCIDNKVPLIIIGKPGTGKSLSFQILYNTLKGEYSESDMFKTKGKLYRYYYQGSETSTAEGIENVFNKASNAQKKNKDRNFITLVFFDEMGLAERSSNNPLKVMHYLLEKDTENSVPFLGISNWRLDAAKINRALTLSITDYDVEDLVETAISIAEALDSELSNKYKDFFESLAKTYYNYILFNQNSLKENKDFHGNRDFYNLIKIAMRELIEKRDNLPKNEKRILSETALISLNRNFGGLENSNEIIKKIFIAEYGFKFDENINYNKKFSILDAIKKNILDPNSRYLMIVSEGNDGSDIVKYLLNSINKNFIELVGSKYKKDIKSGRYSEEILNKIKYIMETDNVLILRDLDMIYASLYDLFNQNFAIMGDKKFARLAFEYAKISSEVNKDFHVIVIINKKKIEELKLDPPFLNRFEKHIVTFNMLLEERDIEIAKKITEYIDLISSYNNNEKLKINLENHLINCKQHNIEGLIFKIKNDENKRKELNQKEGQEYEDYMIKEILNIIVPTFCQDIIASMTSSNIDEKYNKFKDMILNIYKESQYNNFKSFFKNIKSRKNIIYTFSKSTENLFEEEKIGKKEEEIESITNKFGTFNYQSTITKMIDSPKSENDLLYLLKTFANSKNKKLFIFKVTENNTNKINSVNYVISNFEKENPKLKEKLILFVIHKQRQQIQKEEKKKKNVIPDLISFIDDEYYQIFIDNLQGKENMNVLQLMQKKNEDILAQEYIDNSNFIENKIFTTLNYMKYTILFQTKELNIKNYTTQIAEKIIKNQKIKGLIMNNLKKQGKNIKGIINNVFISDTFDINDIDFFEVINTKLSTYFCIYLLNIIFYGFKENVLNAILNNPHLDIIMENQYLDNLITNVFEKTKFNFIPKIKMNINANQIIIYNGLEIPKSKSYLEIIIKYIDETICKGYNENENKLRKKVLENEAESIQKYQNELNNMHKNIKVEINNKIELFKSIYNNENKELKKMILNDYLKYYIIKYSEKREQDYKINEKLLNFLKLIIKIKFSENHNQHFEFENTFDEFIKIVLFTQGYREVIHSFLDACIDIYKYCSDIEEKMNNILDEEDLITYEISERNKKFTKTVNIFLFNLMESFLRAVLLFSIDLIQKDKVKFYEYLYYLTSLEANMQRINRKYFLYSKEIFNLRYIIKIEEGYKSNHEQFENNYINIMNNLLEQTAYLYKANYNSLYNSILELVKIFDETFKEKNNDYVNLLFFIYRQQYKNIYNDEIRIKLVENLLNNKLLVKKSKIFLSETLKDIKPEVQKGKQKDKKYDEEKEKEELIKNFLNIDNNKNLKAFKNLINKCNNINSPELNEILLYFLEGQCQSYFTKILEKFHNKYTEKSCTKLLLNISLEYLKKSIQYLYEHKNNNDNNFLKLYAIAYLKTYCYYYVEVNFSNFEKCNWEKINRLLIDKDENNQLIRNMRNIYIWRLFCKKYENFEKFINNNINTPIFNELKEKLKKEQDNTKYIFKESFITPNVLDIYKKFSLQIDDKFIKNVNEIELNYEEINNNFDVYYSFLVNKIISYTYGNDRNQFINIMKNVYDSSYKQVKLGEEGKQLYNYLLNDNLFQNEIVKKISDNPLTQDEFEIFLYCLRFIFNTQINNSQCFYNEILKKNTANFINNNFIPGSFPLANEYLKSYNILNEKLKQRINMGYYICCECGFLYEVRPCTFPMARDKCPNGHVTGGTDHVCAKKDIRVFYEQNDIQGFINSWRGYPNWYNSFISTTLVDFKANYVDKHVIKPQKGINKDYEISEFEKKSPIRDINIITFRILNFILYSYLLGSYILNNLNKNEVQNYLVENLFPHTLFGIIKKNWELLNIYLREIGIDNIQIFLNMIFEKLIELIKNLKSVDSVDKLLAFEKEVDNYIMSLISKKEDIEELKEQYGKLNNELNTFDPKSIKEIILGNYDPSIYEQNVYPDIQYYSISNIQNYETFVNKFNSSKENENQYSLINMLIKRDEDLTLNAINMKSLENINKLTNILLNVYSYKISRDDAKEKLLKNEIGKIIDDYNEMNPTKINNEEEFIEDYIKPFIESWDLIKKKSVQYKCRVLRDLDKGEKPLDMSIDKKLAYFLVDDGDKDGGMFLAAAYQHLIEWQNAFINVIISKNNMNGILNSYVPLLEQEIDIQDANKEEIINIDDKIFKSFNDLIFHSSMRNIFDSEDKINYKNYNNIIYNFDYIEEELAKAMLPGKKKFKDGKIRFITYLFEGFRGDNSSILTNYNTKYPKKQLREEEEDGLNDLIKAHNNSKFYNDVFASLQILMNEIIKQNYEQDFLIINIIENLPAYIILNQELVQMFKDAKDIYMEEKIFTINSLVTIFEYFESLCWKDIKNNILEDYKLEIPEDSKKIIIEYFEKNKDNEQKLINKANLTTAIRRLISRYIAGTRQEIEINPETQFKLHIGKYEFWTPEMVEDPSFFVEMNEIFKDNVLISHAWKIYNLLEGDTILEKEINKRKEEKQKDEEIKKEEFEINTDSNQNEGENEGNKEGDKKDKKDEDDEEEEENEESERSFDQ